MAAFRTTDRVLTLIVALSCVALVVAGARFLTSRRQAAPSSNQPAIGAQASASAAARGEAPPWVNENDRRHILLITLSSTCSYCDQSSSALRSLVARLSDATRVVVIGGETAAQLSTYSARQGLVVDSTHGMPVTSPYVQWSPRIFLMTSSNALIGEWSGRVDMATADSVLNLVRRVTSVKEDIK